MTDKRRGRRAGVDVNVSSAVGISWPMLARGLAAPMPLTPGQPLRSIGGEAGRNGGHGPRRAARSANASSAARTETTAYLRFRRPPVISCSTPISTSSVIAASAPIAET